jgi:hypothetical protein
MGRILKFLIYIACLIVIGVVLYAYVGPWFGVDFSAPQGEVRVPVVLDAN